MNFNNYIGKQIEYAIKGSSKTQKQIAMMLNISEGNITNWKKGTNLPSLEIFTKLCILLDADANELLGINDSNMKINKSIITGGNFNNTGNINIR